MKKRIIKSIALTLGVLTMAAPDFKIASAEWRRTGSEAFRKCVGSDIKSDQWSLRIIIEDNNGITLCTSFDDTLKNINLLTEPENDIL